MSQYLDKLKTLHLHVPVLGLGTAADLQNIYDRYIPILANASAITDEYSLLTCELRNKAEGISSLLRGINEVYAKSAQEAFFEAACQNLKADIKVLITIIESRSAG